jgi:hypothetical protein
LLPHWIEHHAEHARELRALAERIQLAGQGDTAEKLLATAALLQQASDNLSNLLAELGEVDRI